MDKVSTDLLNDIVDSDLGCQRLKSEHENVNWKHWLELPDVACVREFNNIHLLVYKIVTCTWGSTDIGEMVSSKIILVLKHIYLSLQFLD